MVWAVVQRCVNRHTGGLEKSSNRIIQTGTVNRHTGGLENWQTYHYRLEVVNRHTGGLETANNTGLVRT